MLNAIVRRNPAVETASDRSGRTTPAFAVFDAAALNALLAP
ncbi:hypothetical protein OG863_01275 [Streptomyces decoyicus]|uniref:Uncharacterized protein n=1 Tax=Streptomyces decoyicus TaxID=249567 RepID=A0ABZ1F9C5_9ACTN|nr:hypothetical protein [Streptomyces decoyicus]WSB66709.1 hypothetical protein OG863_01275 [Streptomyces decoyicus]